MSQKEEVVRLLQELPLQGKERLIEKILNDGLTDETVAEIEAATLEQPEKLELKIILKHAALRGQLRQWKRTQRLRKFWQRLFKR